MKLHRFFILCSTLLIFGYSAQAATYKIQILEIPVEQKAFDILCSEEDRPCIATIPLYKNNRDRENIFLQVAIEFNSGAAFFQFAAGDQSLAITSIGGQRLEIPLQNTAVQKKVILYKPHPLLQKNDLRSTPVLRVSRDIVTSLIIFITPEP